MSNTAAAQITECNAKLQKIHKDATTAYAKLPRDMQSEIDKKLLARNRTNERVNYEHDFIQFLLEALDECQTKVAAAPRSGIANDSAYLQYINDTAFVARTHTRDRAYRIWTRRVLTLVKAMVFEVLTTGDGCAVDVPLNDGTKTAMYTLSAQVETGADSATILKLTSSEGQRAPLLTEAAAAMKRDDVKATASSGTEIGSVKLRLSPSPQTAWTTWMSFIAVQREVVRVSERILTLLDSTESRPVVCSRVKNRNRCNVSGFCSFDSNSGMCSYNAPAWNGTNESPTEASAARQMNSSMRR